MPNIAQFPVYLLQFAALTVVAVLIVPIRLRLNLSYRSPHFEVALNAKLLAGLVSFDWQANAGHSRFMPTLLGRPLYRPHMRPKGKRTGNHATSGKHREETHVPEPTAPVTGKQNRRRFWHLLDQIYLFLPPASRYLRGLGRAFRLPQIEINGRVGFEDPAITGAFCSYLRALDTLFSRRLLICVQPDFTACVVEGSARLTCRLRLVYLLLFSGGLIIEIGWRWLGMCLSRRSFHPLGIPRP